MFFFVFFLTDFAVTTQTLAPGIKVLHAHHVNPSQQPSFSLHAALNCSSSFTSTRITHRTLLRNWWNKLQEASPGISDAEIHSTSPDWTVLCAIKGPVQPVQEQRGQDSSLASHHSAECLWWKARSSHRWQGVELFGASWLSKLLLALSVCVGLSVSIK